MADGKIRFSITERGKDAHIPIPGAGRDVNIVDYQAVKAVMDDIHNMNGSTNWALLGYYGNSDDTLVLLGSGTETGTDKILAQLNENEASYAIVRVVDKVDGVATHRYALILWMGDRVPGMKKARIGTNKTAVLSVIGHYNVEILASEKSEITTDAVVRKVQQASGSLNLVRETVSKPQCAAAGKSSSFFGGNETQKQAVNYRDVGRLRQLIADIRNDSTPTDWMLIGYEDAKNTTLGEVGSGTGGLAALEKHLKPDSINYGFLRVTDTLDKDITAVRFIFIHWVGDEVKPMVKGRVSTHIGALDEFFAPYHTKIAGGTPAEVSSAAIQARLQELKGSKKQK